MNPSKPRSTFIGIICKSLSLTTPKSSVSTSTATQYFEPVPIELWEYPIGGYQVLAKWLKDRNDRQLTMEEIKTFCRVVTAIKQTIALQEEIDALYAAAEKRIIGMGTGS